MGTALHLIGPSLIVWKKNAMNRKKKLIHLVLITILQVVLAHPPESLFLLGAVS